MVVNLIFYNNIVKKKYQGIIVYMLLWQLQPARGRGGGVRRCGGGHGGGRARDASRPRGAGAAPRPRTRLAALACLARRARTLSGPAPPSPPQQYGIVLSLHPPHIYFKVKVEQLAAFTAN